MLDKSIYDLASSVALHRKWAIVLTFDVSNAKCDQQKTITNTEVLHEEVAFSVEASRFILRQNAPLRHLIFKMFSEVPTSKTSFQIAAECNN